MNSYAWPWSDLDRKLAARADWPLPPTPSLIAEPSPSVIAEPVAEHAEPVGPEAPVWYTDALGARPARARRRRLRRRRLVLVSTTVIVLTAFGGAAAVVGEVLPWTSRADKTTTNATNPGTTTGTPAVVVSGPGGEPLTCTTVGTEGDDDLRGTGGADVLCGLGGADRLTAKGGDDVLVGGDGDDTLVGGNGRDRSYGGRGRDAFTARDGSADLLDGGRGRDRADAGWLDVHSGIESFTDPVVVAAGDIACDPRAVSFNGGSGTTGRCHQEATGKLVEAAEPDDVLLLGDLQYENGSYSKYQQSYDPTWGRFRQISHPTPGRAHDAFGRGGYYRYWGSAAGPRTTLSYSFDVGAWHIVSLNSNCAHGSCKAGSPQELWLRADLAGHPAKCTLAFWHQPIVSSTEPASPTLEALWQALYDGGVDLVVNADAHNYERFKPKTPTGSRDKRRGIVNFVVGTGGKSHEQFHRRARGSVIRNDDTFGVLKLRLRPAEYDWEFVPEPGSDFHDAGTQACH